MSDAHIRAMLERLKGDDRLIIAAGRDDTGSVTLTHHLTPEFVLRAFRAVLRGVLDETPLGPRDLHMGMIEECLTVLAQLDDPEGADDDG
jgi:hypothetical protein